VHRHRADPLGVSAAQGSRADGTVQGPVLQSDFRYLSETKTLTKESGFGRLPLKTLLGRLVVALRLPVR
jgi:hypothetical protein